MSDYLLVPTNVQAFVVGKPSDQLYDLAHVPGTEDEVANWYVGHHRKRASFFDTKLGPLATGIHLHWALPAALMRSRHVGTEPPTQPLIPNRWLVLRMWHAAGKPTTISAKAWVVESDYVSLAADSGGSPFPFLGPNPPAELKGMHCGHVGRAIAVPDPHVPGSDVGGWQETHEKYRFKLNSLGWGDPSFAAYYPACKGVLGFHDKMEDVAKDDRVTYLVIGWYSDPASDPLHAASQPDTVQECKKRLASLGWSYPNLDRLDVRALPQRTLCNGGVVGVTWHGSDWTDPATPAGALPTVAIGGSAAEALVAMLAPVQPDQKALKALQQVLCAFQLGQATQVSDDDQLGDLLHRQSFGAVPGGTFWTVEPGRAARAARCRAVVATAAVREGSGAPRQAERSAAGARPARKEGRVAALAVVRVLGNLGEQTGRAVSRSPQESCRGCSDGFCFGGFEKGHWGPAAKRGGGQGLQG